MEERFSQVLLSATWLSAQVRASATVVVSVSVFVAVASSRYILILGKYVKVKRIR